jgi:catalase
MANNQSGWFKLASTPPIHSKEPGPKAKDPQPPGPKPQTAHPAPARRPAEPRSGGASAAPLHSQTVGPRGPVLMQDTILHEIMEEFANSTTLLRVVHTKGYGALGFFKPAASMAEYTSAAFFQDPARATPVAVRFSLAASDNSTPDTSRNIRGFSTKFYTDAGIFDLLCNSIPVFFVRDAIDVPRTIAALAPSPVNNLPDPDRFWGMFARTPEATNLLVWLFSDVGTAKSFRTIPFFGVSTYVWKNDRGVRRYVKYHWLPVAEMEYIDRREAARLACENPNIAGQELYDAIASQQPVEFDLAVQLMDPADEAALPYDPLDDTKIWDEGRYPLVRVGRLTLNRNPDDFSNQIDKLAFAPANLVEGIELSDDKMLQGRAIVYSDAQRHRLGNHFRELPANRQAGWTPLSMVTSGEDRFVEGVLVRSEIPKQDDFAQAGEFFASLSGRQQQALVENLAADLAAASAENRRGVLAHLRKASPDLAGQVSAQMGRAAG